MSGEQLSAELAALHDTRVTMIERHYSRWITDCLDELAAHAIARLVSDPVETHAEGG